MQFRRRLTNWFALRDADRLFLFLLLHLVTTVVASIELRRFEFFAWPIWVGIGLTFSCLLAWQPWRSWQLWLGIGLMVTVNYFFYQFLVFEAYESAKPFRCGLTRDQSAMRAMIGFAIVFTSGKAIYSLTRLKVARWILDTRIRILMSIAASLMCLHFIIMAMDLRPLDLSNTTLCDTPGYWSVALPCWVVLPPFLIGRLFHKGWFRYALAISTLAGCWIGALFLYEKTFLLFTTVVVAIAHLLSLAIVSSSLAPKQKVKYRPNLTTLIGTIGICIAFFSLFQQFNVPALFRASNSERWTYANDIAKLKSIQSKGALVEIQVADEREWPNERFLIEIDMHAISAESVCHQLPKTLWGELTLTNATVEDCLEIPSDTGFLLAIKNSRVTTKQHEYLEGFKLVNTVILCQHSHEYSQPTFLNFESNTLETTLQSLRSLSAAKFKRENFNIQTDHQVNAEFWQLVSTLDKNPTFQYYAPLVFFEAFSDDPDKNKQWFENVPADLGLEGTIVFVLNVANGDINQLSPAQIRLLLDSKYFFTPTNFNEAIANPSYVLHWDIAFAANPHGRFYPPKLNSPDLTQTIIESELKLLDQFHWRFDTDLKNSERPSAGLIVPYYDQRLFSTICRSLPALEVLSLNEGWIKNSGAYSEEGDRPLDDLVKLADLRELYLGDQYDVSDLSWLGHLPKLEHLECFPPSVHIDDCGFDFAGACPNLKTVVLINNAPPELVSKFIQQPRLEEIILYLPNYQVASATERWAEEAKTNSKAEKIKVIGFNDEEGTPDKYSIPKSFQMHLDQVRKAVREKLIPKD